MSNKRHRNQPSDPMAALRSLGRRAASSAAKCNLAQSEDDDGRPYVTPVVVASKNVAHSEQGEDWHTSPHGLQVSYSPRHGFEGRRDGELLFSRASEARALRELVEDYEGWKAFFWTERRRSYSDEEVQADILGILQRDHLQRNDPQRMAGVVDVMINDLCYDDTPEVRARLQRLVGTMGMPPDFEQRQRLQDLMQDSAGWEALMIMTIPGDVAVAVSFAPSLRGYEIVSVVADGRYDIWKRSRAGGMPYIVETDLTKAEVGNWLAERTPPEAEFKAHAREWMEDVMAFYRIPRKA